MASSTIGGDSDMGRSRSGGGRGSRECGEGLGLGEGTEPCRPGAWCGPSWPAGPVAPVGWGGGRPFSFCFLFLVFSFYCFSFLLV